MNEQELTQNYVNAFNHLMVLIRDAEDALDRAQHTNDSLAIRQYGHLKKNYVQQLAELIGRRPKSVMLQAVTH